MWFGSDRSVTDLQRVPGPTTVDEHHFDLETYWSRNRISRRSVLRGALVGAGAIALVNFPQLKSAFAASGGVSGSTGAILVGRHLSFSGDGGNDRDTSSMRVTAQVIFPDGVHGRRIRAYVRYGTGWGLGQRVDAEIVNLVGVVPNSPQGTLAGNQFYAKALLDGLRPAATTTTGSN